ncbi:hypothetical protein RN001_009144 [Aquatica leii]|uniref:15-hydroxyprostaglandin dehydrogenase [NAD(+)]-like n=1 Tax=Aquatica leii TaxID=1421715 RepID=A0AAN7P683_9COLE|nr:hypothetical protein RN001_009144 [Aquatica leii]
MFDLYGKVALVTGGASSLGFLYVKELLRHGVKGICIVDINDSYGERAIRQIKNEYGDDKAIFVSADVADKYQLEEAFKSTIQAFEHLDIVINSAHIFNDAIWEREVQTNINGTINGTILGFDYYLPIYKTGSEGLIVNFSSVTGIDPTANCPVSVATKFAVLGLGRSFGSKLQYERHNVKVITICSGFTDPALADFICHERLLGPTYHEILEKEIDSFVVQPPLFVAKSLMNIISEAETGSVWVVEGEQPPYEVEFSNRVQLKKKS